MGWGGGVPSSRKKREEEWSYRLLSEGVSACQRVIGERGGKRRQPRVSVR